MKMPKRAIQHVSETASYKIFSKKIPNNWIIREVTERDYGIDCYVELVDKNNCLTGHLISFQLKSQTNIKWSKKNPDFYNFPAIDIGTVNYWYLFAVPVFICLVDIGEEQVYFLPVRTFVRRNFKKYALQDKLSFRFSKKLELNAIDGIPALLFSYFNDLKINQFERNAITFIIHYQQYQDFVEMNVGRDCFLGVEIDRILYLKHMYNNLRSLSNYLNMEWRVEPVQEYEKSSQAIFGKIYRMYEQQMSEVVSLLGEMLLPTLLSLKKVICEEEDGYWLRVNNELFNYMFNMDESGISSCL